MDRISFTQDYPFRPFLMLAFRRYFTRPIWMFLYAFWLGFTLLSFTGSNSFFPTNTLIYFLCFLIFLPYVVYANTRNLFRTHHMFEDEIHFTIDDKEILAKGSHFESRMDWEVIRQVKEYPNWMMLFLSNQSSYYIYKNQLDPAEWLILKSIIRGRTDITSKLRKE
ncbi:MAG: YcxB family protein [Bacteroidia bacterium]|nr:YcxB family protein [Bacteroidia bacterium]